MSKQTVRLQRITTEEYDPDDLILSGAALWAVVGLLLLVGFCAGALVMESQLSHLGLW